VVSLTKPIGKLPLNGMVASVQLGS
jgi:hypothetical protein